MIKLTEEQNEVRSGLLDRIYREEHISVLKGYAGVGKSVVISKVENELLEMGFNPAYVAYTGQAAKILNEKGANASTIHSLIYEPIIKRGVLIGFRKREREELSTNLLIVDEMSMVSKDIWMDLESYRIQIIATGDDGQLQPIKGSANPYFGKAHLRLNTVMRQALESKILWAATQVRTNQPVLNGSYGDQLFVGNTSALKDEWYRPDVQFIVGRNITKDKINTIINKGDKPVIGSKIMFLKNDPKMNIVNGTVVDILEIKKTGYNTNLTFMLDGMLVEDYKADFKEPLIKNSQFFDLAYAMSAHKSQGSTIDSPLVIIDESYCFPGDEARWKYTVLTRSSGKKPVAWLR